MAEIHMGIPSQRIRSWILDHRQAKIVWKEACNPDGTPLSDIASAEWLGSKGQTLTAISNSNGSLMVEFTASGETVSKYAKGFLPDGTSTNYYKDAIGSVVRLELYEGTSYYTKYGCVFFRKYTPGHWEDADGNWIEGSYGDWALAYTDDSAFTLESQPYIDEGTGKWKLTYKGYALNVSQLDTQNAVQNANLLYRPNDASATKVYYVSRLWTTTKPAPNV